MVQPKIWVIFTIFDSLRSSMGARRGILIIWVWWSLSPTEPRTIGLFHHPICYESAPRNAHKNLVCRRKFFSFLYSEIGCAKNNRRPTSYGALNLFPSRVICLSSSWSYLTWFDHCDSLTYLTIQKPRWSKISVGLIARRSYLLHSMVDKPYIKVLTRRQRNDWMNEIWQRKSIEQQRYEV